MYRLFIVDDNKYERIGIKNSIDWNGLGIEVVGVFANGLEALDKIDELKPHIIITDIAMPVMDGIEMSEYIKKNYPEIKIIFISCHSDFEFAKSAVDMGIHGYVLKPIISDELAKAVEKLLNEFGIRDLQLQEKENMMKQIVEMLPLVQEQFFKELLLGNFHDEEDIQNRIEFLKIPIEEHCNICVMSIKINDSVRSTSDSKVIDAYLISYTIKSAITSFSCRIRKIYPTQISDGEFAAILFDNSNSSENMNTGVNMQDSILNTAVDINTEISRRLDLNTTMGVSKCSMKLTDIALLYKQSYKAVNTRFYSGSNPIIMFNEIEDISDSPFEEMTNLQLLYNDVKTLISDGTDQDIEDFVNKYLNREGSRPDENYVKSFTYFVVNIVGIILMESNKSFKDIFGDDLLIWRKLSQFDTIMDVKQWIYNIFKNINEYLTGRSNIKNSKVVEEAKNIIKKRYHEQITVEDISNSVYLSSRHLNNLFKKETGRTIFDYIIEYRIETAKKLLKEPDSKVASIAEMIGYTNTSYFCLAFKKNVGMTPAEYKSKVII